MKGSYNISILILVTICCACAFSHLVPEVVLEESKIFCRPPTGFNSNVARWLVQGRYNRSSNYIFLNELQDRNSTMCQLESYNGELTGWSEPVQLRSEGMSHPALTKLTPQRVLTSSNNDLVNLSCGIQIDDAGKRNIELIRLLTSTSSCQSSSPEQLYIKNFNTPLNLTAVLKKEPEAEIFVQDLSVRVNLSAFELHNERLFIECGIRLNNAPEFIYGCNEIIVKDEHSVVPTATSAPSVCPMEDREKKSVFHLHFLSTRCEQYKVGTKLRHILKQNQCLEDGNFMTRVSCENESSGELVLYSPRKISEQTLSTALSDVAQVDEILSTPTPWDDSTSSEMTDCTPDFIPIVISTVIGFVIFLLSVVVHLGLCFGKRMYRHRTQPSHEHQAPPVGEGNLGVPQSPSQQVSVEDDHNSMMITDPLPMTTSAPIEAEAGTVESSAQVTPPSTVHAVLIRRHNAPKNSTRGFNHEHTTLPMSPLQQFTRGGTPGPSAGVGGEPLLPGTTDDSIGMPGEYVAHHDEQSTHQHRQAASHLNETQSGLAGNHRYLGIAPQYCFPQLDENSTIAHHQPYAAVPLLYLPKATYLYEAAPGAVPMYVPMCRMVPQQDPPAPVDNS